MSSIKTFYWAVLMDVAGMWFWFLSKLPGNTGIALRALLIPPLLGACGKRQTIQLNLRVANPEKLRIGNDCNFGQGVFITAGGGVTLGDFVGMGPDAKIWSVNHRFEDPGVPWLTQGYESKEVVIEDDVWIGANAFIMPGVHIGKGAIISAGSVLSKSVPAFSIVAGNPGRVIGWRKKPEAGIEGGDGKAAGPEEAAA
ncbi:MAG: hypothetical protein JWP91_1744 [Fibrobacteres bacterium]|nr:hypothetical protein [Fibrobacterota bacterium]